MCVFVYVCFPSLNPQHSPLCNPIDSSPPGSPVPGILQARILEWLPFPSPMQESEKWKWSLSVLSDSYRPPWIVAYQAPPSMGFSRQEYWSGLPLPSLQHCPSHLYIIIPILGFLGGSVVKNLPINAGDAGSISRLERSPGEGNANPLQ